MTVDSEELRARVYVEVRDAILRRARMYETGRYANELWVYRRGLRDAAEIADDMYKSARKEGVRNDAAT